MVGAPVMATDLRASMSLMHRRPRCRGRDRSSTASIISIAAMSGSRRNCQAVGADIERVGGD
jgi:UDP-N-acetylglucosamine enolpyruvyl transferase